MHCVPEPGDSQAPAAPIPPRSLEMLHVHERKTRVLPFPVGLGSRTWARVWLLYHTVTSTRAGTGCCGSLPPCVPPGRTPGVRAWRGCVTQCSLSDGEASGTKWAEQITGRCREAGAKSPSLARGTSGQPWPFPVGACVSYVSSCSQHIRRNKSQKIKSKTMLP